VNDVPRWVVHVVNGASGRRWGSRFERFEDPVPLVDVRITLDLPDQLGRAQIGRAWQAGSGAEIALRHLAAPDGRIEIELPRIDTDGVIVLETAAR
jgi:hypothetical protein